MLQRDKKRREKKHVPSSSIDSRNRVVAAPRKDNTPPVKTARQMAPICRLPDPGEMLWYPLSPMLRRYDLYSKYLLIIPDRRYRLPR